MSDDNKKRMGEKILTPMFRLAFASLFEPKLQINKIDLKYEMTMLFDKATDLTPLKDAVKKLVNDYYGGEKPPANFSTFEEVFKDGNVPNTKGKVHDGYEGCIVVKASSIEKFKPGVVDQAKNVISGYPGIKSGDYARAYILPRVYDYAGKTGFGFYIRSVQKVRTGEELGGGSVDASKEFDEIPDDNNPDTKGMFDAPKADAKVDDWS